jgi:lipopolysaccharide/colanic/teichoic acid biosynthesis glycosyltransferase
MKHRTNIPLQSILILADLVLLVTALFSASLLEGPMPWGTRLDDIDAPFPAMDLQLYLAAIGSWLAVAVVSGTYRATTDRMAYRELADVIKAMLMSAILLSGFLYLTRRDVALIRFWYFIALSLLLLVVFRVAIRTAYRLVFHRYFRSAMIAPLRVVVVGEGPILYDTLCTLSNCDPKEVALMGFLDYQADLESAITDVVDQTGPLSAASLDGGKNGAHDTHRGNGTSAPATVGPSNGREPVPHLAASALAVIEPVRTRASERAAARMAAVQGPGVRDQGSEAAAVLDTPSVALDAGASPLRAGPLAHAPSIGSSPLGLAIENLVLSRQADNVVVAMSRTHHRLLARVVAELQRLPVHIVLIPDVADLTILDVGVTELGKAPALKLRAPILTGKQLAFKRVIDLVFVSALLPFLLPLMALVAIAIKLDAPGPIIFKQKRVGQYGREFTIFKFRTMVHDAEKRLREAVTYSDDGKPLFKSEGGDPRITRVGRVLRRLSIDELPQLFNVLLGQMSLVGPRPELPRYLGYYDTWQHFRLWMPPGITGWWQVNGRDRQPMYMYWDDDLYYIRNYSLLLDLQILWLTFSSAVLGSTGR